MQQELGNSKWQLENHYGENKQFLFCLRYFSKKEDAWISTFKVLQYSMTVHVNAHSKKLERFNGQIWLPKHPPSCHAIWAWQQLMTTGKLLLTNLWGHLKRFLLDFTNILLINSLWCIFASLNWPITGSDNGLLSIKPPPEPRLDYCQ